MKEFKKEANKPELIQNPPIDFKTIKIEKLTINEDVYKKLFEKSSLNPFSGLMGDSTLNWLSKKSVLHLIFPSRLSKWDICKIFKYCISSLRLQLCTTNTWL